HRIEHLIWIPDDVNAASALRSGPLKPFGPEIVRHTNQNPQFVTNLSYPAEIGPRCRVRIHARKPERWREPVHSLSDGLQPVARRRPAFDQVLIPRSAPNGSIFRRRNNPREKVGLIWPVPC